MTNLDIILKSRDITLTTKVCIVKAMVFPVVMYRCECWTTKKAESEKVKVKSFSRVRLFVTPWTVAYQAPPSMGFSRQECWSGLPFPSPGNLPNPGIKPRSPTLQADALPSEPPVCQSLLIVNIKKLPTSLWIKESLPHCTPSENTIPLSRSVVQSPTR